MCNTHFGMGSLGTHTGESQDILTPGGVDPAIDANKLEDGLDILLDNNTDEDNEAREGNNAGNASINKEASDSNNEKDIPKHYATRFEEESKPVGN